MKVKLLSDIHLEFCEFEIPYSGEDLLIIAGDTSPDRVRCVMMIEDYLRKISEKSGIRVILISGNHDFYGNTIEDTDEYYRSINLPGVVYLQNDSVVIGGVRFFGSTMWTDMNGESVSCMKECAARIADFSQIVGFTPMDACKLHSKGCGALMECLNESPEPVIVITHHLPSYLSIHPKYKNAKHINGSFAATDMGRFLLHPNTKIWCHGHTHSSFDYETSGTRVICNPRGYAEKVKGKVKTENAEFDPNFIFDFQGEI